MFLKKMWWSKRKTNNSIYTYGGRDYRIFGNNFVEKDVFFYGNTPEYLGVMYTLEEAVVAGVLVEVKL